MFENTFGEFCRFSYVLQAPTKPVGAREKLYQTTTSAPAAMFRAVSMSSGSPKSNAMDL